jgi:hypothetical protein
MVFLDIKQLLSDVVKRLESRTVNFRFDPFKFQQSSPSPSRTIAISFAVTRSPVLFARAIDFVATRLASLSVWHLQSSII